MSTKGVDSICFNLLFLEAVFCSHFVSSFLRVVPVSDDCIEVVYEKRGLKKRKARMVLAAASALSSESES